MSTELSRSSRCLLLLEDNEGDCLLVKAKLADAAPGEFHVTHVERLESALAAIASQRFDVILSDLTLPDSDRLSTVKTLVAHAPSLPLVVLTGSNDTELGEAAIMHGAQDYLLKDDAGGPLIARALRYALERKRLELDLREANMLLEQRVAARTAELEAALDKLNESLARARALTAAAPDAIVTIDAAGIIIGWNKAAERLFGYAEAEAIGQALTLIVPERFHQRHHDGLQRRLTDDAAPLKGKSIEVAGRRRDGGEFPLELSVAQWSTAQGKFFSGVMRDITERKLIERQLTEQRDHLEELVAKRTAALSVALAAAQLADRTKDAFLANVSHELRTPLNAVIGLSSLAQRLSNDPKLSDYLTKIENSGKTLARIINDLLDLSKIAAGRMELDPAAFNLRRFLDRACSVMSYKLTEKGLQFIQQVDAQLPNVLVGDSLRLEQILLNLLSNAVKFTAAGTITLRAALVARMGEQIRLSLEVEDTGIGLRAEDIARLFLPFSQADASVSRKFGGTGLGLALCKHLAEMMGGGIDVSSREGCGSTFRVEVQLAQGDAASAPADEHADSLGSALVRYRATQVLVVDDQAMNREIVGELLTSVGIAPRMAVHGQEALDILDQTGGGFDLVLMDIQMPIMDGIAATRELRRRAEFAALPVVAMTAHAMEHEKQMSFAAGMNDHIGKPFEAETFYRMLAKWIPLDKQQVTLSATANAPASHGLSALQRIDTESGLARFSANEERYRYWLWEFVREAPNFSMEVRQALAKRNLDHAGKLVHAFKGRVGMLGMNELFSLAAALEAALRDGEASGDLLDELHRLALAIGREIESTLDAPAASSPAAATPPLQPTDAVPEALAHLIPLLDAADGGSAAAIAASLVEFADTPWEARLRQALAHARRFDFAAARQWLA